MKHLPTKRGRLRLLYGGAALLFLVAALLGLCLGSTVLSPVALWQALSEGSADAPALRILFYVRLPRTAAALLCGGALAVSGAIIQGVLHNRLASPSIVGVNAGAGLAVTLCCALGAVGGWAISLCAFLGALLTVLVVALGAKHFGASRGTVILAGVAINSLLGAISDTVVTLCPEAALLGNDFRVGDFSSVTADRLLPAFLIILASLAIAMTLSPELEVLSLGEENARGLGLHTGRSRMILLILAALLAGAAVSLAGLLSFVGLLVPHAVSRLGVKDTRHTLPLSALLGGGFVCLCDTLSRTLFSPYEIPVGIPLAFLGAPFFLFLLIRKKGGHAHD